MFKVMLKRTAPAGKDQALAHLLTQMRVKASGIRGYISGETLRNTANPGEYLTISIWDGEDNWKNWMASEERRAVQDQIDALIGPNTEYETYRYPHSAHTV